MTTRLIGIVLSMLVWVVSAAAQGSYTFRTLDVPGSTCTSASKINEQGQIVGGYCDGGTSHSFLWDGSTFTTITIPNSTNDQALGINNRGQIVGGYVDTQGIEHGYL
jgi:uncharacterized membrane protein